jgi:branched-chain amino acid transport system substrate-binding protein
MKTAPVLVLLMVMAGGLLLAGCTQNQATIAPAPFAKIGVVASMTGPASATGKDIWQSAMIAADEITTEGHVKSSAGTSPSNSCGDDGPPARGQKAVSETDLERRCRGLSAGSRAL